VADDAASDVQDPSQPWSAQGRTATAALAETWRSLADVGRALDPAQWRAPTECPGWDVQDQLSHLIGIERLLLGEAPPPWDGPLGDHVRTDFAEGNEPWIAIRRATPGEEILAEFVTVTDRRLGVLGELTEEEWGQVGPTIIGEVAYADFMRTRVFDSWVHEQDVRLAVGCPGGRGGLASSLAIDQVQRAMGFVVGKKAGAPEGSVVRFSITGPSHDARSFTLAIRDGRAGPESDQARPTVTLSMSSLDFVRLGCGRVHGWRNDADTGAADAAVAADAAAVGAAARVEVEGDAALGNRVLDSMNFMF
jgi:uncharacterized protein (TIGR03083 family)